MSKGTYLVDLSDSSDLTQIIEDMITEGREPADARISELEEELEDANSEISELNNRIAELEEELELQIGETK